MKTVRHTPVAAQCRRRMTMRHGRARHSNTPHMPDTPATTANDSKKRNPHNCADANVSFGTQAHDFGDRCHMPGRLAANIQTTWHN
ncbi:hypothetical protein [Bifidobacterium thermophilum]|uniref:hypothetical protein n=1 Tax=Bifidobacterium thermophilum TaxID=33905 RepID=UPI0030B2C653